MGANHLITQAHHPDTRLTFSSTFLLHLTCPFKKTEKIQKGGRSQLFQNKTQDRNRSWPRAQNRANHSQLPAASSSTNILGKPTAAGDYLLSLWTPSWMFSTSDWEWRA